MTRTSAVQCVLLVAVAVLLPLQLVRVHEQTWDLRLWPSSTPTKLVEGGRDYARGSSAAALDPTFVLLDHRWGADVLGPVTSPYATTLLVLRTDDGLTTYGLKGGP